MTYFSPQHPVYYHPYEQETSTHSTPSSLDNHYQESTDRQFGSLFPFFGGLIGGPIGPPLGPPPGQGLEAGAPTTPPPSFIPTQQAVPFAIDPGSIRRCLFRFTYVWLTGRQQFWFFPTFVGRQSVSGFRWTGFRWVYFGISLRQIQSFTCF